MPRHLLIPEDVRFVDNESKPVFESGADGKPDPAKPVMRSMSQLVCETLCNDPKWGASLAKIRMSNGIFVAFQARKAFEIVKLSDDEWKEGKEILESPSVPYNPPVARQLMPLFDAWCDAVPDAELEKMQKKASALKGIAAETGSTPSTKPTPIPEG